MGRDQSRGGSGWEHWRPWPACRRGRESEMAVTETKTQQQACRAGNPAEPGAPRQAGDSLNLGEGARGRRRPRGPAPGLEAKRSQCVPGKCRRSAEPHTLLVLDRALGCSPRSAVQLAGPRGDQSALAALPSVCRLGRGCRLRPPPGVGVGGSRLQAASLLEHLLAALTVVSVTLLLTQPFAAVYSGRLLP